MDVWMRRPVVSAVLVDREYALDIPRRAPKGLLDGVTDGPFRGRAVQPSEAFGGPVVDRQDEAEIRRPAQPPRILGEGSLDRFLVATEGSVAIANAEELPPLASLQALLSMRDIADLLGDLVRAPVVPSLDEEHSLPPFGPGLTHRFVKFAFRLGEGLLPLISRDASQLGEQLVFGDLEAPALCRPVGEKPHQAKGRRAQELDDRADAFEGLQDLLGLPGGDAFSSAKRLAGDGEIVAGGA
jgi:hypothetical protein